MTPRRNAPDRNDDPDSDYAGAERIVSGGLDRPSGRHAVPDFAAARKHVLTELVRFTGSLQREGVDVPATGSLEAARALAVVGLADREAVADALRATLLSEAADLEAFDAEFPTFWHRLRSGIDRIATHEGDHDRSNDGAPEPTPDSRPERRDAPRLDDADAPPFEAGDGPETVDVRIPTGRRHATDARPDAGDADDRARQYSAGGGRESVTVDGALPTDAELEAIDRFVDAVATIPGRRTRAAVGADRIDPRRALRASLQTGGAPVELPTREPVPSEFRCCLLVDVSGSVLDTIDRETLLLVAERLQTAARSCSVFLFDTELVDATEQFSRANGDPAAALRAAEIAWGGGTRIGSALEHLRNRHPNAVDRRTVVVVVSDGLDVGDPDALQEGITWLARRAEAVLWLNPLAVSPAYEPRSRGMATCLPYVDGLFGFAAPADLAAIAAQLDRRGIDGSIGYEYDPRRIRRSDESQPTAVDGGDGE